MVTSTILITLLLVLAGTFTVFAKKLTVAAATLGVIMSVVIFIGAGHFALLMLAAFFLLGTTATWWKRAYKQQLGVAEVNKGQRTAGQVWANAGVATLLSLLMIFWPTQTHLFGLMLAAAFASATADTLSSELGNVYGRRFYNIISLKPDTRGLDGVISLEGIILGIAGSSIIAAIYLIHKDVVLLEMLVVIVAGTIGNLADSVLGATLERKQLIGNNAVNFLNTLAGALAAALFSFFF